MGGGGQQLGSYGGTQGNYPYGSGNFFTGGTPLQQGPPNQTPNVGNTPVGSAGWLQTHPDFNAPAQGVGSRDWVNTHPNYGMNQQNPQNFFTGGTPLQGGGSDIGKLMQQMLGGHVGGGGGGYGLY